MCKSIDRYIYINGQKDIQIDKLEKNKSGGKKLNQQMNPLAKRKKGWTRFSNRRYKGVIPRNLKDEYTK